MNRREMRKRIWAAVFEAWPTERGAVVTIRERLDNARNLAFKFKTPSFANKCRWEKAEHEVCMMIAKHAALD